MAHMSNYLENKLIDLIFRSGTFTTPSALYVGLFTTNPSDTGGGTEVSGGSYARAQLNPSTSNWADTAGGTAATSSGTTGTTSNKAAITWSTAPTANWGTVTGIGIFDASTSGNLLFWAPLSANKTINSGDAAPSFAIGALTVQIDN